MRYVFKYENKSQYQFYGDVRVYYSLKYALLMDAELEDAVWCMTQALNKEEIGLSV